MGMESVCAGLQDGAGEAAIPGALSFGRIITVLFYFCLLCGYYGEVLMDPAIAPFEVSAGFHLLFLPCPFISWDGSRWP